MKITILGCGSSSGVPMIGCDCKTCTSDNPKNKRTRVSVLIETGDAHILIDSSPDLRQQALRHKIKRLSAVLYTHDHADHTHGIDDLRSFNYLAGDGIPIYTNQATVDRLQLRFPYAFMGKPDIWFRPFVIPNIISDGPVNSFSIGDISAIAYEQKHGKTISLGFRIGNFAYSTDVDQLSEEAFKALEGVDTWVVDCLRYSQSYSHSNLANTLGWIERVRPRRAILTHMAHDFDYDTLLSELPAGIEPAFDGMIVELNN